MDTYLDLVLSNGAAPDVADPAPFVDRRRRMPSRRTVFAFWSERLEFLAYRKPGDASFGSLLIAEPEGRQPVIGCFACGRPDTVRAHILARAEGGSDEAGNLHLLCGGCHTDSELLSGDAYWTWLRAVPRVSWVDHYAGRLGYGSFSAFVDSVRASVGLEEGAGSLPETLYGVGGADLVRRLTDAGHDPALVEAILASRDSAAGYSLEASLRDVIRRKVTTAASVRSAEAIRRVVVSGVRRSAESLASAAEARRQRADAAIMECGHILLEMRGQPRHRIAAMLTEMEMVSPSGRAEWTGQAVAKATDRYLELIGMA